MSLDLLSKHGVCCALHFSYPRYNNRLAPSMLGLKMESAADEALVRSPTLPMMGSHYKAIASFESATRGEFNKHTLDLHHGTGLRFCPAAGLSALLEVVQRAEPEFKALASSFIAGFPQTMELIKENWREFVDRQSNLTPELRKALLDYVMARMPKDPPSVDAYRFSVDFLELKTPETPGMSDLSVAEAAEAADAWARMKQSAEEDARRFTSTFMMNCRQELHARLHDFFKDMATLVETGKPINKRTVARVREFLSTMQELNFTNDATVTALTTQIRESFGPSFSVDAGIKDDRIVDDVKMAVTAALKHLEVEMNTEDTNGTEARLRAMMGVTSESKEESTQLDIKI